MTLSKHLALLALAIHASGCAATAPSFEARESLDSTGGTFALLWQKQSAQLQVIDAADPSRVLWETPAGGDFLRAAVGAEHVDSGRGCFTFDDHVSSSCGKAVISSVERDGDAFVATGTLTECGAPWTLRFDERSPRQLAFTLDVGAASGTVFNRVYLSYTSRSDESFFGFGHQYGTLDMKGRRLPIWSGEQGIGRGQQPISGALSLVGGGCAGD
jgi:alpha-glucosidase